MPSSRRKQSDVTQTHTVWVDCEQLVHSSPRRITTAKAMLAICEYIPKAKATSFILFCIMQIYLFEA